jgi:N-acetylneuraminate synthase
MTSEIASSNFKLSKTNATYFIADIAANHDGSLERALRLIELCAESGANAAKFQHFRAETIVSDLGFQALGKKLTHQAKWRTSVFEVYKNAELPLEWTEALVEKCREVGIDFFSAVYDLSFIKELASSMPFFKVGSGDIDWTQAIDRILETGKPIFLATGASTIGEVRKTVNYIGNRVPLVLMQCNTNYTADNENLQYLNLKVLETYKSEFPNAILGLSDHTQKNEVIVGAVAMGARVIERHFTDDIDRIGPDHKFSLNPVMWRDMVKQVRSLESALGDGEKKVEDNEKDARVVQRRSIRANREIKKGERVSEEDLICLRPCPIEALSPAEINQVIGSVAKHDLKIHELIPRDWLIKP